jgi:hypothetical protein
VLRGEHYRGATTARFSVINGAKRLSLLPQAVRGAPKEAQRTSQNGKPPSPSTNVPSPRRFRLPPTSQKLTVRSRKALSATTGARSFSIFGVPSREWPVSSTVSRLNSREGARHRIAHENESENDLHDAMGHPKQTQPGSRISGSGPSPGLLSTESIHRNSRRINQTPARRGGGRGGACRYPVPCLDSPSLIMARENWDRLPQDPFGSGRNHPTPNSHPPPSVYSACTPTPSCAAFRH